MKQKRLKNLFEPFLFGMIASIDIFIIDKKHHFFMLEEFLQILTDRKENQAKLVMIKSIHTAVWVFFNVVLVYLFYTVLTDQIGVLFWLGVGAYFFEFVILLIYRWNCPITFWARKYSNSMKDNFDIYLPNWFARYNKTIYSILIVILLILFILTQFVL